MNTNLQNLLNKKLSRKGFLGFGVVLFASAFGVYEGLSNFGTTTPGTTTPGTTTPSRFPFAASISSNKRYIVDQNGDPWLMVGDSPQCLMTNLAPAEMATYFANRQSLGFNCVLIMAIVGPDNGNGNSNYANYNGVAPFTGTAISSQPNSAYFDLVVTMVELAASYGLTVILDPAEAGDFLAPIQSAGGKACFKYGAYLGTLLANQPNVIWQSGGDYGSWPGDDDVVLQVAAGIASTAPHQLQSVELLATEANGPALSTDDSAWPNEFSSTFYNGVYDYWSTYPAVLDGYNHSPVFPVWGQEYNYEGENNAELDGSAAVSLQSLRAQQYWTMTCGATGSLFGNHYLWGFISGWQSNLSTPGAEQFGYLASLFKSVAWYKLVPDQSHTFMTGGYGTAGGDQADPQSDAYCTAALTADGTLGVAYLPTSATITVAMSKMAGTTTARWYDPTMGTYASIDTYPNAGTRSFTSPGAHGDGSDDWVLVLTAP